MNNQRNKELSEMYEAILTLKNVDECYNFFEDLCTINELDVMSQRMVVAKMLRKKTVYAEIVKSTGASTATISRVNRALTYGKQGYNMVIDRMNLNEDV